MNNTVKTVILCVACMAAIVAVAFFVYTIVSPPPTLDPIDQFYTDIDDDIAATNRRQDYAHADSLFDNVLMRLNVYTQEGLLTDEKADYLIDRYVKVYVPLFAADAHKKLTQKVWKYDQLQRMERRIQQMQAMRHVDKSAVLDKSLSEQIIPIDKTLKDYHAAINVANIDYFADFDQASKAVADAKTYKEHKYLKNNQALVEKLDAVPRNINQSQYNQLSQAVALVDEYEQYDKDYYERSIIRNAEEAIKTYNSQKTIYPDPLDAEPLKDHVDKAYTAALQYYNRPQ